MAIFPGSAIPTSGAAEYTIDQSLRFEDGSSAYLSRTPASAGNRKTWTYSFWTKLALGQNGVFFASNGTSDSTYFDFRTNSSYQLQLGYWSGTYYSSSPIFRDPSAWYHIVVAFDTTQATQADRLKVYVNGEMLTDSNSLPYNTDLGINNSSAQYIGGYGASAHHDGYMSEVHFIDGQALAPDYFGEVDETYGHWKPIEYTGTYGTNGFYLSFQGTFYNDASGNGNNWTANNLATTDVVLDSPTNNFCTLNPIAAQYSTRTLSEGNLKTSGTSSGGYAATQEITQKVYAEFTVSNISGNVGVIGFQGLHGTNYYNGALGFYGNGNILLGAGGTGSSVTAYSNGDVVMLAYDPETYKVWYGLNGTWDNSGNPAAGTGYVYQGSSSTFPSGVTFGGWCGGGEGADIVFNFGQDSSFAGNKTAQGNTDSNGIGDFYYTPPTGFLALCTKNLPESTVVPSENFNTVLYTGNDVAHDITGVGFQPDFVWVKSRSNPNGHRLADSVRGATKTLFSNFTYADDTADCFDAFVSDGFTVGTDGDTNGNAKTFVAWNWKADNTSGSSNTDGSITSTVAANVDAGFSIVSYTGTGTAGATVGHGLSSAPDVVIVKNRDDGTRGWMVYHSGNTAAPATDYLFLNSTNATSDYEGAWNDNAPTSTVFSIGNSNETNQNTANHIAYAFHSVDGYSKFGSYTGNGSTDGPFVYTGFRPAFVLWKKSTGVGADWNIFDATRDSYNVSNKTLYPNLSNAEVTSFGKVDLLSSGFKIRVTNTDTNVSGETYIYMAFAESPFKRSNAR